MWEIGSKHTRKKGIARVAICLHMAHLRQKCKRLKDNGKSRARATHVMMMTMTTTTPTTTKKNWTKWVCFTFMQCALPLSYFLFILLINYPFVWLHRARLPTSRQFFFLILHPTRRASLIAEWMCHYHKRVHIFVFLNRCKLILEGNYFWQFVQSCAIMQFFLRLNAHTWKILIHPFTP